MNNHPAKTESIQDLFVTDPRQRLDMALDTIRMMLKNEDERFTGMTQLELIDKRNELKATSISNGHEKYKIQELVDLIDALLMLEIQRKEQGLENIGAALSSLNVALFKRNLLDMTA